MSDLLSDYKLKCQNHINILDREITDLGGMRSYGLVGEALSWLVSFPKRLWHQVLCPDNPHWEYVEKWQLMIYGKTGEQQNQYQIQLREMQQLTKKKEEIII